MATINRLSTEIINAVGGYLDPASILALRLTDHDLGTKIYYNHTTMFSSIKVSFCQLSIDIFDQITQRQKIASKVEHVIVGTETLDQYASTVSDEFKVKYNTLWAEEQNQRTSVVEKLRACFLRFPNLKDIRIEDRPNPRGLGVSPKPSGCETYQSSLGSSTIKDLMGIDLGWNGPSKYPHSRRYAFAAMFAIIRDLGMLGVKPKLDVCVGTYNSSKFRPVSYNPFDVTKGLARQAFAANLRHLDLRDMVEGAGMSFLEDLLEQPSITSLQRLESLSLIAMEAERFFCKAVGSTHSNLGHLSCLEIRTCFLTFEPSFEIFLTSSNIKTMRLVKIEQHFILWIETFMVLTHMPALQNLHLSDLHWMESHDGNVPAKLLEVNYEGHEAILAGARSLANQCRVWDLAQMSHTYPHQVDLHEGHMAYLAMRNS